MEGQFFSMSVLGAIAAFPIGVAIGYLRRRKAEKSKAQTHQAVAKRAGSRQVVSQSRVASDRRSLTRRNDSCGNGSKLANQAAIDTIMCDYTPRSSVTCGSSYSDSGYSSSGCSSTSSSSSSCCD